MALWSIFTSQMGRLLVGAMMIGVVAGCGGEKPISTANTKFQPVDNESTPADDQGNNPVDANGTDGAASANSNSIPADPLAGGPSGIRPAPVQPPTPPTSSQGNSTLPPTAPPSDPAAELLTQASTPIQPPQGARSQQEALQLVMEQFAQKIQLAERVLAMKTSPENRYAAVQLKLGILSQLVEFQQPDASKHIREFCAALEKDEQAKIAKLGRTLTTSLMVGDYTSEKSTDFAPIRKRLTESINSPECEVEDAMAYAQAALQLLRAGAVEEGRGIVDLLLTRFDDTDNPELKSMLADLPEQAQVLEVGFEAKRDEFLKGTSEALTAYVDMARGLLEGETKPGFNILSVATQAADDMERAGNLVEAKEVYDLIVAAYSDRDDKEMTSIMQDAVDSATRRMDLIGAPLELKGPMPDGEPLDPAKYKGKHVLIHFWSPQRQGSMQEFQYLLGMMDKFQDRNLMILGVAVGAPEEIKRFFSMQKLPWDNIVDHGDKSSFAHHCGVLRLPFSILVNPEGNVDKLYVMGPSIVPMLEETLPPAPKKEPAEDAAGLEAEDGPDPEAKKKPEAKKPEAKKPEAKKPEAKKPEAKRPEAKKPAAADPPADKPGLDDNSYIFPEELQFVAVFDETPQAQPNEQLLPPLEEPERKLELSKNPYLPRKGLTTKQLVNYIFDMEDRPQSIHRRPGFNEALIFAADKILEDKEAKETHELIAIETKLWAFHLLSVSGNETSDKKMYAYIDELKNDERGRVAKIVEFLQIERRILEVDDLEIDKVPDLLEEALSYCEGNALSDKHLRFASGIVHGINRIEDAEEREEWFKAMGGVFVKSEDRQLARYGKRIAKPKSGGGFSAIGKKMELAGVNVSGLPFDWTAYQGKVVVIDFWATWCGPCVREMPNVKAFYQKHHAQGLELVGVSLDKDLDAVAAFVEDKQIPWDTLVGEENQEIATKYGVRGIPTIMLIDRDGTVVAAAHNIAGIAKKAEELLLNKQ